MNHFHNNIGIKNFVNELKRVLITLSNLFGPSTHIDRHTLHIHTAHTYTRHNILHNACMYPHKVHTHNVTYYTTHLLLKHMTNICTLLLLFPEGHVLANNPLQVSVSNLVQLKGNFGTQLHVYMQYVKLHTVKYVSTKYNHLYTTNKEQVDVLPSKPDALLQVNLLQVNLL